MTEGYGEIYLNPKEARLRIYELETLCDRMAEALQEIVKAHEDVDSGADIPIDIYKEARAILAELAKVKT